MGATSSDTKSATSASDMDQKCQNAFTGHQQVSTAINKNSALFSNCGVFSRLPYEIRLEIYKHVLWDGRLWGVDGELYDDSDDSDNSELPAAASVRNISLCLGASEPMLPRSCAQPNLIAILLTCRWIYLEAVSLLYTTDLDYFKGISNLDTFHRVSEDAPRRMFGLFRVDRPRWRLSQVFEI